ARAWPERHGQRLARALAGVINLWAPDVIVLGGGLSQLAGLADRVTAHWHRWVFGASASEPVRTRLRPSVHGDASGVRGAAWLGRQAQP
ncbi:MAG: ROK family protein, partial [Betaproteobacteria bacterium]